MSQFKREVTMVSYRIEIPMDDFEALSFAEYRMMHDNLIVSEMLEEKTGARDVEYNGHFGNYIYFSLEPSYDTPEEWKTNENIIAQGVKDAKKWMKKNTVTRIVCGRHSEQHYSSTPDLAMDRCPICDAPTTDIQIIIDDDD